MRKVEGIVLEKKPYGESDEIISLLSKERGRVVFRARGLKKSKAKHSGNLQDFNWLEVFFVEGSGFSIITDTYLIDSFSNIKSNLSKIRVVSEITDTLNSFLPKDVVDTVSWCLLNEYLQNLNSKEINEKKIFLSQAFFNFKLLSLHGFAPELDKCVSCQKEIKKEGAVFSIPLGGLMDKTCSLNQNQTHLISSEAISIVKKWPTKEVDKYFSYEEDLERAKELTILVNKFVNWHLNKDIKHANKV